MRRLFFSLVTLSLIGLVAVPATAQEVTCDDIEFAADLVADYPEVGDGCLEIIEKGGERFARLEAEVLREGWETMLVHYKLRDGGWSSPREVTPPEEWRASISGQDLRVRDLEKGQILNVYIREGRWEIAMADLEAETLPVTFGAVVHEVPAEEAPAVEQAPPPVVDETPVVQEPAEDGSSNLLLIFGVVLFVVLFLVLIRRRKKRTEA
jgi:LPXTG-motif cell wall-anchored protein